MRGPFDSMIRWWGKENGKPPVNGKSNGHKVNGKLNGNRLIPPQPQQDESPWLSQYDVHRIPRKLHYPETTLGRIVDQSAARFGGNTAVIFNQETWTYRDLLARINRLAGGLAKLGVRSGDHVLMALPNCPEFILFFFAIQKLGAVVVNAGPLMGVDDLNRVIEITSPVVTIGVDILGKKLIDAAKDRPPKHFVWVSLQGYQDLIHRMGYQIKLWQNRELTNKALHITLEKVLKNAPAKPPTVEPSLDAPAVLQPTSGTTGAVKLVQLTHRNLLSNSTQVMCWMNVREGQESVLAALPMFHIYGLTMSLITGICNASAILPMMRYDTEQCLELLQTHKPTIFPLVPAICDAICTHLGKHEEKADLSTVRLCMTGAAPLPRDLAERFEKLTGIRVVEGYGLSEASPVTHANLPYAPRYGTIGLPLPDTMCRVVDLDDPSKSLPHGQPGELLISGPQIMSGYYHDSQATEKAIYTDDTGRTWLRTGDIARIDDDGYFQIMDRKKDMIIRSGLKVYPAKVERVLSQHPLIEAVAVIGQPDPIHTEEVAAVIVLKSKEIADANQLRDQLKAYCREHLAPYEVPHRIIFRNELPRTALGKPMKALLRAELSTEEDGPPPPKPIDHQPKRKEAA